MLCSGTSRLTWFRAVKSPKRLVTLLAVRIILEEFQAKVDKKIKAERPELVD